jgi:hypothetical protein
MRQSDARGKDECVKTDVSVVAKKAHLTLRTYNTSIIFLPFSVAYETLIAQTFSSSSAP